MSDSDARTRATHPRHMTDEEVIGERAAQLRELSPTARQSPAACPPSMCRISPVTKVTICAITRCVMWKNPARFTAVIVAKSLGVYSVNGFPM